MYHKGQSLTNTWAKAKISVLNTRPEKERKAHPATCWYEDLEVVIVKKSALKPRPKRQKEESVKKKIKA